MENNYNIRAYKKGDEKGIIDLFLTSFNQKIDTDYWRWKFCRLKTVYSYVVESNNQIVGHVGAFPLKGRYQHKHLDCFQLCDVMIHPDVRGGMGSKSIYVQAFKKTVEAILEKHPKAFCFGYPGRRILTLAQRAGIYGNAEQALISEFSSSFKRLRLIQMRSLEWSDKRLDQLWNKLKNQYSLIINRDQSYLNWRYAQHPSKDYQLVGFYFIGKLIGWAVVQAKENSLHIIDILTPKKWLKQSLLTLSSYAAALNLEKVHIWLPTGWRDLSGQNIKAEQFVSDSYCVNVTWKTAIKTQQVSDNFYYTMGDLDIF